MEPTTVSHSQFEDALTELQRIKHLKRALAHCVELFAACGGDCKGTCENPRVILKAEGGMEFTCCAMWHTRDMVEQAKAQEKQVRQRIERAADSALAKNTTKAHRKEATDSLKMKQSHSRDFTGTAVARKRALAKTPDEDIIRRAMEALHGGDE